MQHGGFLKMVPSSVPEVQALRLDVGLAGLLVDSLTISYLLQVKLESYVYICR